MDVRLLSGQAQLAHFSNEQLLALVLENESEAALNELVLRHWDMANRFVGWLAHKARLSAVDREDAQAQAVLGIREAVQRFDPARVASLDRIGQCMHHLLLKVLCSRFHDFLKSRRRRNRHANLAHLRWPKASGTSSGVFRLRPASVHLRNNPEAIAQQNELRCRVENELARLGSMERSLCEQIMIGRPLHDFALANDVSYPRVKRCWKKVKKRLGAGFRNPANWVD